MMNYLIREFYQWHLIRFLLQSYQKWVNIRVYKLLINVETKILTTVLANKLEHVVLFIIKDDQTGFIKTRHAKDSIGLNVDVIDVMNKVAI